MDELIKSVELEGRTFQLHKPTALDGLKIAKLLAAKVLPLAGDGGGFEALMSADMGSLAGVLDQVTNSDLDWLVRKSLSLCSVKLPAGWTQIVDAAGQYQVEGVEYDPVLTIKLTVEVLRWGCGGFFDGNRWKDWNPLAELGISRPGSQT
jgi:hypothetical protein